MKRHSISEHAKIHEGLMDKFVKLHANYLSSPQSRIAREKEMIAEHEENIRCLSRAVEEV